MNQLIQSFMGQGEIGFGFFIVIIAISILGLIKSIKISKEYEGLTIAFNDSGKIIVEGKQELNVENDLLQGIIEDFKKSAKRGTENINTEVIIQKTLEKNNKIFKKEKFVKLIPSVCIGLGLLGTFVGLTLAIVQTRGVLGGAMGSTQQFSQAMEAPFASMSSAFWTSICGVFSSLILNMSNVNLDNKKESFYDEIEDYLDNTIYAYYGKTVGAQISEFNGTLRYTMTNLTEEMRDLFQDGVKELVSKINKNTIDLTDTVKELTNYTKDLDRLTNSLDTSVKNFKEPVDSFKSSIHGYLQTSENTTNMMKDSVNKFAIKVDTLDSDLNNVQNIIKSNKEELENVGILINNQLSSSIATINNSYMKLVEAVELISNNQNSNNENLKLQTENLGKIYKDLRGLLSRFLDDLKIANNELCGTMSSSIENQYENLSYKIVDRLNTSMEELEQSSQLLRENTSQIGDLVKQTNDLYLSRQKDDMFNY